MDFKYYKLFGSSVLRGGDCEWVLIRMMALISAEHPSLLKLFLENSSALLNFGYLLPVDILTHLGESEENIYPWKPQEWTTAEWREEMTSVFHFYSQEMRAFINASRPDSTLSCKCRGFSVMSYFIHNFFHCIKRTVNSAWMINERLDTSYNSKQAADKHLLRFYSLSYSRGKW